MARLRARTHLLVHKPQGLPRPVEGLEGGVEEAQQRVDGSAVPPVAGPGGVGPGGQRGRRGLWPPRARGVRLERRRTAAKSGSAAAEAGTSRQWSRRESRSSAGRSRDARRRRKESYALWTPVRLPLAAAPGPYRPGPSPPPHGPPPRGRRRGGRWRPGRGGETRASPSLGADGSEGTSGREGEGGVCRPARVPRTRSTRGGGGWGRPRRAAQRGFFVDGQRNFPNN